LARAADGIWILGGNQNLIMELLHDKDGGESPLLSIMRDTCLGGSSAGAAVMSDPMIGGGTSFGALSSPRAAKSGDGELSPGFFVTKGLGFFPEGIVDQHFDSRARLGRLLEILLGEDGGKRPGFGIAEATGLIYRRAGRSLKVAGAGPVCVVEPQGGRRSLVDGRLGPLPRIEGATIHLLNEGDSYDLTSGRPLFPTRRPIAAGDEALDLARPTATGILSPYGSLAGAASRLLLDNARENLLADDGSGLRYVRSYLFEEGGEGGAAWEVRLGLIEGRSALHYRDGDGSYSVDSVRVDILPVRIDIGPYR
jgi:cyanophycinase